MRNDSLVTFLVLAACGNSPASPDPDGPLAADASAPDAPIGPITVRSIAASATDPAITDLIGQHYVAIGPAAGSFGRLFVFFPGSNGRPDQYSLLLHRAAELGYSVIGLAYDNRDAVNDICVQPQTTCQEAVRVEVLLGVESGFTPPAVTVENSAFRRLVRLLQYLHTNFPSEGWERFFDGDEPRWELVAVSGHSQGGGHAAMTAKLNAVPRAILFDATEPALWTQEPLATPVDSLYAIAHSSESGYTGISRSWTQLAIPGAVTLVDTGTYAGAHQLVTSTEACRGDPATNGFYHGCPVTDDHTPLDANAAPAFTPIWDYLLR